MSEPVAGIELSIDLHHDLLTVRQAAELALGATDDPEQRRRNEQRVHQWVSRKRLIPVHDQKGEPVRDADGKLQFLGIDVLRALAGAKSRDRRGGKHDEPTHRSKHDTRK